MGEVSNEPISTFYPRSRITQERGDVFHAVKCTDPNFNGFGEAYFTTINFGMIKGWKMHHIMHLNLIVIHGSVRFYVRKEGECQAETFEMDQTNYGCLHIKPGAWVAFEGLSNGRNIILNIASEPHDPAEAESRPLSDFPLL